MCDQLGAYIHFYTGEVDSTDKTQILLRRKDR